MIKLEFLKVMNENIKSHEAFIKMQEKFLERSRQSLEESNSNFRDLLKYSFVEKLKNNNAINADFLISDFCNNFDYKSFKLEGITMNEDGGIS